MRCHLVCFSLSKLSRIWIWNTALNLKNYSSWLAFSTRRIIWSFHVVVFQRTAMKCTKNYNYNELLLPKSPWKFNSRLTKLTNCYDLYKCISNKVQKYHGGASYFISNLDIAHSMSNRIFIFDSLTCAVTFCCLDVLKCA